MARSTKILSACIALSVLAAPAVASAQINRPGAHPDYSVELEPHFVFDWGDDDGAGDDEALGVGMRATIPFLDNGPIDKINNNMGIGFGLDWTHSRDACEYYYRSRFWNDCTVNHFHFPVVVQWNFWLTPIVSVFGELGFEIEHTEWDLDDEFCDACDGDSTDIDPVFWGGGRFSFGENASVGAVVRLGWPYLSAGIGILL